MLISLINEEVSRWTRVGDALAVARHSELLHLRDVLQRYSVFGEVYHVETP